MNYVAANDNITRFGESPEQIASGLYEWHLDYEKGELWVDNGMHTASFINYERDPINGFNREEMYNQVRKYLISLAKQRGWIFYKQI